MRYKYITSSGEDAFATSFDEAGWFDAYGFAHVKDEGQSLYINPQGKVTLQSKYETMFDEWGLGLIHVNNGDDIWTNKYGIMEANGNLLVPIKYDDLGYRGCGLFCAVLKKIALCLDSSGRPLFELKGFQLLDDNEFRDNRLLVGRRSKAYFVNTKGEVVHGPYWSAQMYSETLAYVKFCEESKPIFVDVNGNTAMTLEQYDSVSEYWGDGVLSVQYKSKFGLINTAGQYVLEPIYDSISSIWNGYFTATRRSLRFIINNAGVIKFQIPNEIASLRYAEENVVTYEKDGKWGYMNLITGAFITKPIYEEAGPMRCGRAPVAVL